MRILIAGCGWLGTEIARRLIARGDSVTAIVRRDESATLLRSMGFEAHALDLTLPKMEGIDLARIDGVVTAQAASGHDVAAYRSAYVEATRRVLDFERGGGPLVCIGSTGVFGRRDGSWVDETTPPDPTEATAEVLVETERLVLGASRGAGRTMVVRCSGLYGPDRTGTVARVRSGRLALGPGDGTWMNFSHRDDAAAVVIAALDRGRSGAIYHASDASPATRGDVVRWIAARLGIEPHQGDSGVDAEARRGANRRVSGEATRLELGVALSYPSFREGLEALIR